MCGELVATHILAYNFLKKSGSSSGGIIRPRPPRFCPGFLGLPAINQLRQMIQEIKLLIAIPILGNVLRFLGELLRNR